MSEDSELALHRLTPGRPNSKFPGKPNREKTMKNEVKQNENQKETQPVGAAMARELSPAEIASVGGGVIGGTGVGPTDHYPVW